MMEESAGRATFRGHLLDDEDILWMGQPDPSVLFAPGDIFLGPFSITWGGFALVWEALVVAALLRGEDRAANGGSLWFMAVLGLIFVTLGLYLIIGRHVLKRAWKQRTHYAVTNRRVIIVTRLFGENFRAEFVDGINSLKKFVRSSGTGSIQFGDAPSWVTMYANTGMDLLGSMYARMPLAFFDITDVAHVYLLVNDLKRKYMEDRAWL